MRTYPISTKIYYEYVENPRPLDNVLCSTLTQDLLVSEELDNEVPDKNFCTTILYGDAKIKIDASLVALASRSFISGTEMEYLFRAFDCMYFCIKFDYTKRRGFATVDVYQNGHDLSCHYPCNHLEDVAYGVFEYEDGDE